MPYWRLHYHLVWATRDRAPLIEEPAARAIEASIRSTCQEPGVRLHAIGVMPDHVHVALSLPPRLALAAHVGRLKGAAGYAVNSADQRPHTVHFNWQQEYGALSFGDRALPDVIAYVRNQPERHAANHTWATLERTSDETV